MPVRSQMWNQVRFLGSVSELGRITESKEKSRWRSWVLVVGRMQTARRERGCVPFKGAVAATCKPPAGDKADSCLARSGYMRRGRDDEKDSRGQVWGS